MLSGIIAITALFGVVAVKYLTIVILQRLKSNVLAHDSEVRRLKGLLKVAESSKIAAEVDLKREERRKRALDLKSQRIVKELAKLKQ